MTNKALHSVDSKSKVYKKYKDKDHPAVQRANETAAKEIKKAIWNFEKLAHNINAVSRVPVTGIRGVESPVPAVSSIIALSQYCTVYGVVGRLGLSSKG